MAEKLQWTTVDPREIKAVTEAGTYTVIRTVFDAAKLWFKGEVLHVGSGSFKSSQDFAQKHYDGLYEAAQSAHARAQQGAKP